MAKLTDERLESTLITVLGLDIQVVVYLPAIDVVKDVARVTQGLQDSNLIKLSISIAGAGKGSARFLHCIGRSRRRRTRRCLRQRTTAKLNTQGGARPPGKGNAINDRELAAANLVNFVELVEKILVDVDTALPHVNRSHNSATILARGRGDWAGRPLLRRGVSVARDREPARVQLQHVFERRLRRLLTGSNRTRCL